MARKMGLTGVHSMRKDQLVRALVKAAKSKQNSGARASRSGTERKKRTASSLRAIGGSIQEQHQCLTSQHKAYAGPAHQGVNFQIAQCRG